MDTQNRTARKKHHVIYKTTCLKTGRYYIGMHSTDNLDDGYMGSGKRLWRSIKKHGLDQHRCEIIEHLPDRASLRAREAELVDQILLEDTQCMNIALGGEGGWEHVNANRNWQELSKLALTARAELRKDPIHMQQVSRNCSSGAFNRNIDASNRNAKNPTLHKAFCCDWTGRKHSAETIAKLSLMAKARKINPSAGRPWVYNLEIQQCKKIDAEDLEKYLSSGWIKGRKMKFASIA